MKCAVPLDSLSSRAVTAALVVAREHGVRYETPQLLANGSNVLVWLQPAPVVARIATTTGLVRQPAQHWLARDLALAAFLKTKDIPVIAPSRELPAGPHQHDGFALSFWDHVEHDEEYVASIGEVAPMLRDMHGALRHYSGELKRLNPFFEITRWLDTVEELGVLDEDDLTMLRRGHAEVKERIDALQLPEQPLHGDAHRKNLLKTARDLLWTDFEDSCFGPIAWDVACLGTSAKDSETALACYGELSIEQVSPFLEARDLQGAAWLALLTTRFPDRRERMEQWLETCRRRYS